MDRERAKDIAPKPKTFAEMSLIQRHRTVEKVLDETRALIDGTSPVTRRRLALMEKASEVLAL